MVQEHVPDGLVTLKNAGIPRFYSHVQVKLKTGIIGVDLILKADTVPDAFAAQPVAQADMVKKLVEGEAAMLAAQAEAAAKRRDPHIAIPGPGYQIPSPANLRKMRRNGKN